MGDHDDCLRRDPRDDVTLWWKLVNRGKRSIVLDLKDGDDLTRMRELCSTADVLIENFRPGTLERLGLAPERLHEDNPRLVITRVSGFGQWGPYANRPGFATIAEVDVNLLESMFQMMGPLASASADPHHVARRSIVEVEGVPMQGLIADLSVTPGFIRWVGRPLGADTETVLEELRERLGGAHAR